MNILAACLRDSRPWIAAVLLTWTPVSQAAMGHDNHMAEDPLVGKLAFNLLEYRHGRGDDPLAWNLDAWLGHDLHKVWLKSEGEAIDGSLEEAELQLLYSRAVAPYWDLQVGWRGDLQPTPRRHWLTLGARGLAPWFIEVDTALFVGESGRTALRLDMDYDLLLTQRLILSPEVELNAHGHNDRALGVGSGLSDITWGLRLRYEIHREFAPYIGVRHQRHHGGSARLRRDAGERTSDTRLVLGVRFWY